LESPKETSRLAIIIGVVCAVNLVVFGIEFAFDLDTAVIATLILVEVGAFLYFVYRFVTWAIARFRRQS
jgi:hypothetical protein